MVDVVGALTSLVSAACFDEGDDEDTVARCNAFAHDLRGGRSEHAEIGRDAAAMLAITTRREDVAASGRNAGQQRWSCDCVCSYYHYTLFL